MNKKTKKQTHRICMLLAVVTLLFCCGGCGKKTPREALEAAYEKTFVENNPLETLLGLSELNSVKTTEEAYSSGMSLTLQKLSGQGLEQYGGLLSGLGISVDSASDLRNRRSAGTLDITYGGATYLTLGGQLQGSTFYLTSPQLLNNSISVDFSTLQEDLASDSMLAQTLRDSGITLPEDLFQDLIASITAPTSLQGFVQLTTACKELNDAIAVEQPKKKTVSLPKDVAAKKVYLVTVPQSAYVAFLDTVLQICYDNTTPGVLSGEALTSSSLSEAKTAIRDLADTIGDLELTVAVTKKGYISYAETSVKSDSEQYTFTAAFTGDPNPINKTELVFLATVDGETLRAEYTGTFDSEDNAFSLALDVTGKDTSLLNISCEGSFTDVEKGQGYTLDLDYLELAAADTLSVSLTGDAYIDTTRCDIPAVPDTGYSLFRMDQTDFTSLVLEVLTNVQQDPLLSTLLSSLDLGFSLK